MNNLLPESITTKATCEASDYPNTRSGPKKQTVLVKFPDLGANLIQKNYLVELRDSGGKRPSERLMYVLDKQITDDNGKDEEMTAIIKIIELKKCSANLGDGVAFMLNGGPHDEKNGNNTQIVFTYEGSDQEIFQKEGPKMQFKGPEGGKFDGGQELPGGKKVPKPNFNLGHLKELGYVGYRVKSIKKGDGSREYIAFVDRHIDQHTKEFSEQWVEWLRIHDKGNFKSKNSHPGIPVNNRTWHNWIRMDSAKAEIVFFNVTYS